VQLFFAAGPLSCPSGRSLSKAPADQTPRGCQAGPLVSAAALMNHANMEAGCAKHTGVASFLAIAKTSPARTDNMRPRAASSKEVIDCHLRPSLHHVNRSASRAPRWSALLHYALCITNALILPPGSPQNSAPGVRGWLAVCQDVSRTEGVRASPAETTPVSSACGR